MKHSSSYKRLVKIINKGVYDKETFPLDLVDYLRLGVITQSEYDELISLLEKQTEINIRLVETDPNEERKLSSENIYKLTKKVIEKKYYEESVIICIVSDFRLCEQITRNEFIELTNMIKNIYSDSNE